MSCPNCMNTSGLCTDCEETLTQNQEDKTSKCPTCGNSDIEGHKLTCSAGYEPVPYPPIDELSMLDLFRQQIQDDEQIIDQKDAEIKRLKEELHAYHQMAAEGVWIASMDYGKLIEEHGRLRTAIEKIVHQNRIRGYPNGAEWIELVDYALFALKNSDVK